MQTHKRRSFLVSGLIVGCLVAGQASVSAQSIPKWAVGDSWQVGVWQGQIFRPGSAAAATQGTYKLKGRMVPVAFHVLAIKPVNNNDCYELDILFPPESTGLQRHYQACYRTDTLRLVQITDISVRPDGTTKESVRNYAPTSQGPTFVDDLSSLVPLDWPDWTKENTTSTAGNTAPTSQVMAAVSLSVSGGTSQPANQITLTQGSGPGAVKTVQVWKPGEPWWREAAKFMSGRQVADAVLLEVNGTKLADAPAP